MTNNQVPLTPDDDDIDAALTAKDSPVPKAGDGGNLELWSPDEGPAATA